MRVFVKHTSKVQENYYKKLNSLFKLVFLAFVLGRLMNPNAAYGQLKNPFLNNDFHNLSGSEYFAKFVPAIITMLLMIGAFIFLFMIIQGGIEWIGSGGDKSSYESARNRINNALIGLLILFSIYAIINLIEIFFGINISIFDISDYAIK